MAAKGNPKSMAELLDERDAIAAKLADSERRAEAAEAEVAAQREWLADVRLATLGALGPELAGKIDAQLAKTLSMASGA